MKTIKNHLIPLMLALFLFSTGIFAQTDHQEILNNIENTENYETIELIQMDPALSIFADLVEKSGLDISLRIADDHTLLVPTNEAFGEMEVERLAHLRDPQNRAELVQFVNYHVLPTEVQSHEFEDTNMIETEDGEAITVETSTVGSVVHVGGAELVKSDIRAANGIVHIVNGVIEPNADFVDRR